MMMATLLKKLVHTFLEKMMSKYINLKLAIDSESVNIYIETGGEPIHLAYWTLDEWIEDAESSVPATINAVHLFHTSQDMLIEKLGLSEIEDKLITSEDIENFIGNWGQTHRSICDHLDYEYEGSDELLMDDYFWMPIEKVWCNKNASMFTEKEQMIADFLRNQLES